MGMGGHVPPNILVDPDPLIRGSAPGPRWGLRPQTLVPHHSEEIAATALGYRDFGISGL